MSSRTRLGFAIALVLAAAGTWVFYGASTRPDDASREELTPAALEANASPELSADRGTAQRVESTADAGTPSTTSDITIAGRCVDAGGIAVLDVAFMLERWSLPAGNEKPRALPSIEARTGAEGTLDIRTPHEPSLRLVLSLRDPRYERRTWLWNDVKAGAREDLGEIRVAPGAIVRGKVVDLAGEPIRRHWRVEMERSGETDPLAFAPRADAPEGDLGSERFEISGLGAGRWRITAKYPVFEIRSLVLELAAGETRDVVLQQSSARDPFREITVRPIVPRGMPPPAPAHVRLSRSGGGAEFPDAPKSPHDELRFLDLEPGRYRVEIDDPRFDPWALDDVEPGPSVVTARLEGSSSIALHVLDGITRQPVERFGLALIEHRSSFGELQLQSSGGSPADAENGIEEHPRGIEDLTGLVSGDLRYALAADGWPTRILEIDELAPNETRTVTVELFRGVSIAGEVRTAEKGGAPVEGALVIVFRPARLDDGPHSPYLPNRSGVSDERRYRKELARASSDAAGRFAIERVPPGDWILVALAPGHEAHELLEPNSAAAHVTRERVRVEATAPPEPMLLELPTAAAISGRVTSAADLSVSGIGMKLLRVHDEAHASMDPLLSASRRVATREVDLRWLAPDGAYRFDGLSAGVYRLMLACPIQGGAETPPDSHLRVNTTGILLEEIRLSDGEHVNKDYDVSTQLPARVEARLEVEGGDLDKASFHLQRSAAVLEAVRPEFLLQASRFDARGVAVHAFVHPGRKCIYALGGGGAWLHVFERDVEVAPGARLEVAGKVVLKRGKIEVELAGGTKLADSDVYVIPVRDASLPPFSAGRKLTLDGHARTEVVLPIGRYRIEAPRKERTDPSFATELDWTGAELVLASLVQER